MSGRIKPMLFSTIKGYNRKYFLRDLKAGFLVAIISLPLSIAFAMSAGLRPEQGVYTSIIGGIIVSIFGGSRVQIAGPTGAFVMVIQITLLNYGTVGLALATIMAGIMLILLGVMGIGRLIKYIPTPITTGFTSGIAVIIFTSQMVDFFGLKIDTPKIAVADKWVSYAKNIDSVDIATMIVAIATLVFMFVFAKFVKKLPNSFVALVLGTIVVAILKLDISTLGDIAKMPKPVTITDISFSTLEKLVSPAFTIAMLVAVQALLSAVVTDGIISSHHRATAEMIAQGAANIACGLLGCMPCTGGVARSIANAKNRAKTPISSLVCALTLLAIMLFCLPIIKYVPKAVLAGIIVYVTYNMFNFKAFFNMFKTTKSDLFIMLATLLLTVFTSITSAIAIGMIIAAFIFMKRMTDLIQLKDVTDDYKDEADNHYLVFEKYGKRIDREKVICYEINGPFFFGVANTFISGMMPEMNKAEYCIVRMENVPFVDITAYRAFELIYKTCVKTNTKLLLVDLKAQPRKMLIKQGLMSQIGEENIYDSFEKAILDINVLESA